MRPAWKGEQAFGHRTSLTGHGETPIGQQVQNRQAGTDGASYGKLPTAQMGHVRAFSPRLRRATTAGMAHDHHFLQRLDRVTYEQTQFALALYRDHQLVRLLLDLSEVAAEAERVALALADGGEGPHVVVARSGAFVTCLAKGMTTVGVRIVSRARIDAIIERRADLRERLEVARAFAREGEDEHVFGRRLVVRQNLLTREEIMGASATAPVLVPFLHNPAMKDLGRVMDSAMTHRRDARKRRLAPGVVEAHSRLLWFGAHMAMLGGFMGRETLEPVLSRWQPGVPFSFPTSLMVQKTIVWRGLWCVAQLGDLGLERAMATFATGDFGMNLVDASASLAAIALKSPGLEREVLAFFAPFAKDGGAERFTTLRRTLAERATHTLQQRETVLESAYDVGRQRFVNLAAHRLDASHPAAPRDGHCDPDLARTCRLLDDSPVVEDADIDDLFMALPLVVGAPMEAFYYPNVVARSVLTLWGRDEVAAHMVQVAGLFADPGPASSAKVGRNEPCPCGSGKKAKRCCAE